MSDDAAALRAMLANLEGSQAKDADLLLMQLTPDTARLLELSAIPHIFNEALLPVLDPSAPAPLVAAFVQEVPSLPAVTQVADGYALHDVVREQMFYRWLAPERSVEFSNVSRRLAQYYANPSVFSRAQIESNRSIVVFHALGAELSSGFRAFQTLYADYRANTRFSACETLVRITGEYRPVMSPVQLAWLTFFQAETASDSRNPARAAALLLELAERDLPPDLKIRVLVRLSAALRETNRTKAAQKQAQHALDVALVAPQGQALLYLVYQEQGMVACQLRDVETAEPLFKKAVELGLAANDHLAVANAYNSLGTMLQQMMPRRAIEMFESSRKYLDENRDLARIAQLLNNLGIAYANAGEWEKSQAAYEQSLAIKVAAKDTHGQALTLLNVARVYAKQKKEIEARNALTESAALFESIYDLKSAASARQELARLLRQAGLIKEAESEMQSSAQLFRRINDPKAASELEEEFAPQGRRRSWFGWLLRPFNKKGEPK